MRAIPIAGAAVTAVFAIALAGWYLTSDGGKSSSLAQAPAIPPPSQAKIVSSDPAPETTGTISAPALARVEPAPPHPVPRSVAPKCPAGALGVSRVVEINTTGGPASVFSTSRATTSSSRARWC